MADYRPHAYEYQQLVYGGATGRFDCTAWVGAWLADAHTKGGWTTTGRAIRLASSEPNPDPDSPGLNQAQVDAAVYRLSHGKVNFTLGGIWTPKALTSTMATWLLNGRPLGVAVHRGTLIDLMPDLGAINGFRGGHQVGLIQDDGHNYLFDPLSKIYLPANLGAVWKAAGNLDTGGGRRVGQGYAYVMAGRDIIPSSYEVYIDPAPEAFWTYRVVDGQVVSRRKATGADKPARRTCTKAASYPYGSTRRNLVQVIGRGPLATSSHPYVSPDASAIHYHEVLP